MRKSTVFICITSLSLTLGAILAVHARTGAANAAADVRPCAELVRELSLTDLCLFTEARYTRHPAMADLHSAFQDNPLAFEHFPSGSLVAPSRYRHEGP